MVSWDYFVGFERKPKPRELDRFLKSIGYIRVRNESKTSVKTYESKEGAIDLFYDTKPEKDEEENEPNWRESGKDITSELMISTKEEESVDEAIRLSDALIERYGGVMYDTGLEEFI